MKKLKQKRVKSLTKGCTARIVGRRVQYFAPSLTYSTSKWQNWDLNLGILASQEMLRITKEEQTVVYSEQDIWSLGVFF